MLVIIIGTSIIIIKPWESKSLLIIKDDDAMANEVNSILNTASHDPTYSWGDNDPVHFVTNFKHDYILIADGIENLTAAQVDENIADLQKQYLDYLKNCKSKVLVENAQAHIML